MAEPETNEGAHVRGRELTVQSIFAAVIVGSVPAVSAIAIFPTSSIVWCVIPAVVPSATFGERLAEAEASQASEG